MKKKKVAVLGAMGYVGSNICKALETSNYEVLKIERGTLGVLSLLQKSDIVVHSANPAGRLRAEKNPEKDFRETVDKTADFIRMAKGKRFVLISSLSCRTQLYGNYGRNRRACELLVEGMDSLVIRLGPMFGGKTRDMLHDILQGSPVYVSEDTRYAYTDVKWNAFKIVSLLEERGKIREIGARNSVRLGDIKDFFKSKSEFLGIDETQEPCSCEDGPEASDVFLYAERELADARNT